ncbi:hypothetical protein BB559_006900 [Furculomyces boomerangus]|uniref:Uncharacterized protein n=2 Tax=Harpellales TaxID=61421 RepID=A0A2T9Y007_9FUNG|nr:hypothetical protein BB559_006900 [Furculomyces boomerangus]PVZ97498.1 hypothetical protein BB558_006540 [Smittium angustum]
MENPRSTLIKKLLAIRGPQTINSLFSVVHKEFPAEFEGVTKTALKKIYLKNLKNFGHVRARIVRDAEKVEEIKKNQENKINKDKKEAWVWTLEDHLKEKYINLPIDQARIPPKTILDSINTERQKSKDFWLGKTDEPHDWKQTLIDSNKKTSL